MRLVPVAQPVTRHAPQQKDSGERQDAPGDVPQQHEDNADADHGDADEIALPRQGMPQTVSDEWARSVGHQEPLLAFRSVTPSFYRLLDRLSTDMTTSRGEALGDTRAGPTRVQAHMPWLLRRVNQRYRAAIRDTLAECGFEGLPQPGYWALMVLARGGTEAGHLMAEMGVSKQAVSKLVDALVISGFVNRKPSRVDRRRMDLVLTAKGRKAAGVIQDAARVTDEALVAELGTHRFADFVQMLIQLAGPSGSGTSTSG